ncbi:MAG: exodeoxyribonuclease VII large subunit [Defluviitaleaceae bacterium]|nr:exodeoxyribonuclease VII large subunit [Defluviitaleaceae bacterium]
MTAKGRQVFTVAQVNRYAKGLVEADAILAGLFVEGELSNFNAHSSGHMYFTLKDANAAISGVMFKSHAGHLNFMPKSGMKVVAFGHISLYEKTGQYQLYVEYLEPAGVGGLQLQFEQLKAKLEAQGLFSTTRKRPLPQFARCVAVITSPTGAAVQDIIRIASERNPATKIVVAPALVQGAGAAEDLARALAEVNAWGVADVIIIGRGGGSIEDLWAFNEEVLARAIAASQIPVISAVGHETDFTIADFVADYRAPTPTAAAQTAVYDHSHMAKYIGQLQGQLGQAMDTNIAARRDEIAALFTGLTRQGGNRLRKEWQNLAHLETLLEKVSPYAAFKRGYALAKTPTGTIKSAKEIFQGDHVTLQFADGTAKTEIKEVTHAP